MATTITPAESGNLIEGEPAMAITNVVVFVRLWGTTGALVTANEDGSADVRRREDILGRPDDSIITIPEGFWRYGG